jgi:hypothetical protein
MRPGGWSEKIIQLAQRGVRDAATLTKFAHKVAVPCANP